MTRPLPDRGITPTEQVEFARLVGARAAARLRPASSGRRYAYRVAAPLFAGLVLSFVIAAVIVLVALLRANGHASALARQHRDTNAGTSAVISAVRWQPLRQGDDR